MMKKIRKLIHICKLSQKDLKDWLYVQMQEYYKIKKIKRTKDYLWVKGTLPVCLVAHLDTVHKQMPTQFYLDPTTNSLFSPTGIGGDDRCGVYIILELLKRGFRPSIIFCCDEEIGALGASAFAKIHTTISNINWFLEFDRKGKTDVVCYSDDNPELTKVFEEFGFKKSYGSFSDISKLAPAYGLSAVNVSSGYYKPHTKDEYIKMDDLDWIIDRATEVLSSEYVNNKYEYKERVYTYQYTGKGYSSYYYDYYYGKSSPKNSCWDLYGEDYDELFICDCCKGEFYYSQLKFTQSGWLCPDCIKKFGMVYCNDCKRYVLLNSEKKCLECLKEIKEDGESEGNLQVSNDVL